MTAATHAGFLSRAQIGLAPPRSISRSVWPDRGGVAFHHGGDNVPISSHAECLATWRGWQRFHQQTRGWVDIAYTLGVCPHGYVLAGRGYGIRTAANGTNDGNDRYLAICGIVGARQTVPRPMLEAFAWATAEFRRLGAGTRTVGHTDLKATACPHPDLLKLARELDRKPIPTATEKDVMDPAQERKLDAVADAVAEIHAVIGIGKREDGVTVLRHTESNLSHYLRSVLPSRVASLFPDVDLPSMTAEQRRQMVVELADALPETIAADLADELAARLRSR